MKVVIYFNPSCSKSKEALRLLETQGHEVEIKDYLKEGLSQLEIESIALSLQSCVKGLVRTKEAPYQDLNIDWEDHQAAIRALCEHPILLERPIVIAEGRALIARPPSHLLSFLSGLK